MRLIIMDSTEDMDDFFNVYLDIKLDVDTRKEIISLERERSARRITAKQHRLKILGLMLRSEMNG